MHTLDVTQKLTVTDLVMDPFPYIYLTDALPEDVYQQLSAEYPEQHMMQDGKQHFQARRYRQHEFVPGTVSDLWQRFIAYHNSLEFKNRLLDLFAAAIAKHYPALTNKVRSADVVNRHGSRDHSVEMEVQFVLNGLQQETVRTAHLDNARELWAGLFYMRKDEDHSTGGDLEIYETVSDPSFHGIREVDMEHVRSHKVLSYRKNTLVLFLNTKSSIHGVTPRLDSHCFRRYINMTAHVDRKLFRI